MVFVWGKAQQETFKLLKEEFVKELTLAFANPEKLMRVEADASNFTTEIALCVKMENGWRLYAYMLYKFSATEVNWTVSHLSS